MLYSGTSYFLDLIFLPVPRVSIDIASIVSLLPSTENNAEHFAGLADSTKSLSNAPQDNLRLAKQRETEAQRDDAVKRRVVWDADIIARPNSDTPPTISVAESDMDIDAEGEVDFDDQRSTGWDDRLVNPEEDMPVGIRREDGLVVPIDLSSSALCGEHAIVSGLDVSDLAVSIAMAAPLTILTVPSAFLFSSSGTIDSNRA